MKMKKHISMFATGAIVLAMLPVFAVPISAADIPVSVSSAVRTSYSANTTIIGNNIKLSGYNASESDIRDFVKKVNAAALGKMILPADVTDSKKEYTITGTSDSGYFTVSLVRGKYYDHFIINGNYYPFNKALDKICRKIVGTNVSGSSSDEVADRLLTYSIRCNEPKNEQEYMNAARSLVGKWLDTLKNETGEYKIGSYVFNDETLPTERNMLRAEGLISGGREFCVTVGFEVNGLSKESVFSQPKNSGYGKFYNYYSGALVVVRCRWENGVCRILAYGSGSSELTAGLNGIREKNSAYDTLFDFYRDTKQVEKLNKACTYNILGRYGIAASSPVYMADGRIGYVAIYPRNYAETGKDGIKTAEYNNGFFDESYNSTYSSPIDFKDGKGAQRENFREKFSLVFDDYNGDGSADYAIKQSAEDETSDGAKYEVRCMSNDLTPRAERFDFFMAGRHEESIRLQHTDSGRYVYWSKGNDGKIVSNVPVDDYRMYSERYYLPEAYRWYDDEKSIYCFFWNNTAKDVKVGGKYHIEYNKNGEWVSVSNDKTLANTTAKAYRDTELKFDISDIKRNYGEYRIVMKVAGKTIYGGFYIGVRGESISVSANQKVIPAGIGYIEFTVKNNGTEPVRLSSAYVTSGSKKISEAPVDNSLILAGGEKSLTAELDRSLKPGKYTIKVPCGKKTASFSFTVKKVGDDALTFFGGKCTAKISGGKLTVSVKNNKYTKETFTLTPYDTGYPEVFMNNRWTRTVWELTSEGSTLDIPYGKTGTYTFVDGYSEQYKMIMEDPKMLAQAKEFYDEIMAKIKEESSESLGISEEEYKKYKNMTFEEFTKLLFFGDTETIEPPKNSLYRLKLNGEYVYFVI